PHPSRQRHIGPGTYRSVARTLAIHTWSHPVGDPMTTGPQCILEVATPMPEARMQIAYRVLDALRDEHDVAIEHIALQRAVTGWHQHEAQRLRTTDPAIPTIGELA